MAKTLAQLKKDAKEGCISLELQPVGHWENGLMDRVKGIRKVVGANSVALKLENAVDPSKTSELRIPQATLVEYTDEELTIYRPGYRKPNAEEQAVLDEWKAITETENYKERLRVDCLSDGSSTYWQQVAFFKDKGFEYLRGSDVQKGMLLDEHRRAEGKEDYIRDTKIRGTIDLQYKVYKMN